MAKRLTPIRLDENLLRSLDRFVVAWNRGGAPSTNRTLVIRTAIEQYLKHWKPALKKSKAVGKRNAANIPDRVLDFPVSAGPATRDQRILREVM
jgi:hypothetical protein